MTSALRNPRTFDRPGAPHILLTWQENNAGEVVPTNEWHEYLTPGGSHFGEEIHDRCPSDEVLALLTEEEVQMFKPLILAAREFERAIVMGGLWSHKQSGCPMDERCDLYRPLVILREAIDHIIAQRA